MTLALIIPGLRMGASPAAAPVVRIGGTWTETGRGIEWRERYRAITWNAAGRSITWTARENGMADVIIAHSQEDFLVRFSFANLPEFVAGDSIASVTSIILTGRKSAAPALTFGTPSVTGTATFTARLTLGSVAVGYRYDVEALVLTTAGLSRKLVAILDTTDR